MDAGIDLRRVVGFADACELFSAVFSFPDESLAEALSDGSLQSDMASCFQDAGLACDEVSDGSAWRRLVALEGCDASALLERMKRAYSIVYLAPGEPRIFPYEAAFLHKAAKREGAPSLFRSPVTLDVERAMRDAGVMTEDSRRFPCDSVDRELAFCSFLAGSMAACLHQGDEDAAHVWHSRIDAFSSEHLRRWLPGFFEATEKDEEADIYRDLAVLAHAFTNALAAFCRASERDDVR